MRKVFCETLGTKLELPDTLQRIISFSPAVTETIFLLGGGDSVVGVSAFCARPPESRKKRAVGSYNTVDKAVLDSLNPDLVLTTTGYQREFAQGLSLDLPVFAVELPVSVAGIVDMVTKVGLILNRTSQANMLTRTLLDTIGRLNPIGGSLRAYVEIDFSQPVSFGAYSYITDALRLLGTETIYGNEPCEWLSPDLSYVKKSDPDIVIYEAKMFSRFNDKDLKSLVEARGWSMMRAVQNGQVFLTPGPLDFLAHHGPSFITVVMPWLRTCLETVARSASSTFSAVQKAGLGPV